MDADVSGVTVDELQTLPESTNARTSHHRWIGGERSRKIKCSTIFIQRMRKGHIVDEINTGTGSRALLGTLQILYVLGQSVWP